jgi:hypothetical protein
MCIGITASETQEAFTFTFDDRDDLAEHACGGLGTFNNVFTVAMWTPAKIRGVRYK